MYGFRRGVGSGAGGNVSTLGGGANGLITLWNGTNTVTGIPAGTWSGTGHTFVLGSPTFNASDGHFTGPAGASFGPSAVGGGFTNQPAGDTIDLVSDDAGDTTQQVTIIGTLAGVDAGENILLNGVTPVTSVGTYDLILALVLNGACVGTVTASETSGGLAITTIAPAALSAGLQTFGAIDGYGKELQIVASGATTKTVGIGGYAIGGGIQREPVVLTGTTKVNTTNTWEGAVQFYLGDLEATRTVTLNSIAGFDFSPGLISIGTQQDTFISRASAGLLLVEDGSGSARDVQARTVFVADATGSAGSIVPGLNSTSEPGTGIGRVGSNKLGVQVGGYSYATFEGDGFHLGQSGQIFLGTGAPESVTADAIIGRGAAATIQLGGTNAASPIAQTLQSQGSRAGTDTNVAGGSLTIRPGAGTGSATGSSIVLQTPTATGSGTGAQAQATRLTISEPAVIAAVPVRLKGYTVATLPAGTVGDTAYVTDALAPAFGVALVGGGAVVIPAFYDGTNWIGH